MLWYFIIIIIIIIIMYDDELNIFFNFSAHTNWMHRVDHAVGSIHAYNQTKATPIKVQSVFLVRLHKFCQRKLFEDHVYLFV